VHNIQNVQARAEELGYHVETEPSTRETEKRPPQSASAEL
jgi:hypothetical protein